MSGISEASPEAAFAAFEDVDETVLSDDEWTERAGLDERIEASLSVLASLADEACRARPRPSITGVE